MIPKEQMDAIAVMIGVDADVFAKAVSNEQEQSLELPKGRFITEENEAILMDNHGKKKYDEGISKKAKENFDGKTKEEYDKNLKSLTLEESKIEPTKRINELNRLVEKLQKSLSESEKREQESISRLSTYKKRQSILSRMPTNSVGLSNETVLSEMTAKGWDFTGEEPTLNGEVQRDSYQNPKKVEDIFAQFMTEKNWLSVEKNGRNGGDQGSGGSTSANYEQFLKQCESEGINPAGAEAQAKASQLARDNPEFYA